MMSYAIVFFVVRHIVLLMSVQCILMKSLMFVLGVGTHEGRILVFHIPPKGSNVTLSQTLEGKSFVAENQDIEYQDM